MSQVNNKQIAINTIFLYIRMLVVMAIGLYTVRAYLSILGETDYGLYNVVGGVVSMFAFLNGTLAISSQRYFSQALVHDDKQLVNRVFCLNLTIFMILIIAIAIILETVGLWFLNTKMTIPSERLAAANIVYQISIMTFALQMITISYNALIISHEKMKAFAYIGILEAVLKLGFVFVLAQLTYDKLVSYAIFMFLLYLLIAGIYVYYCHHNFEESYFKFYWNKQEAKEMLSFSGWHLFGTFSATIRSQGINILLNLFFNPAINAARAVAFQVYNAVSQLSNNFFTAVKPQIYKSYEAGEKDDMYNLILRSTILSTLLLALLVFPILANTSYILGIWLKDVPEYTVVFTQLVLINGLVDTTNGPTASAILATGRIRTYELIVGGLYVLTLPVSYVALLLGCEPTITMIISIIVVFVVTFARAFFMCKLIGFNINKYQIMFLRLTLATIVTWIIIKLTVLDTATSFMEFIALSLFVCLVTIVSYVVIACNKEDLKIALNFIKRLKK